MKMIVFLITTVCSFCAANCFSQNFAKGFYINQTGDTIHGYISKPDIDKNNFSIAYKNDPADVNIKTIPGDSCRAFSRGDNFFITWYGKRNISYIYRVDQTVVNNENGITGSIPLKLIYTGKSISLYHYKDIADHFFVQSADTLQELIIMYRYTTDAEKRAVFTNPPTYTFYPAYRNQITALLSENPTKKQSRWIGNCNYEMAEFIKLFKRLHL